MMKLQRAAWVLALLAFAADAGSVSRLLQEEGEAAAEEDTGEAATADETGETTGETGEAEAETAEGEECAEGDENCPKATEECAEGDENCPAEEGAKAEEEPEEEREKFEPGGNPTKPYQYIFSQGAWNWEGSTIIAPFTKNQIATAGEENKNQDEDIVMRVDDKINIEVGRIDGQTGWTGVNQAGSKTMSYQIAIII